MCGDLMDNFINEGNEWKPKPKQLKAIALMLDFEQSLNKKEICELVGIAPKTLWNWLQDDRFVHYLNKHIDKQVNGEVGEVWKALCRKAKMGETSAIKLFFELTGRYKEKRCIDVVGKEIVIRWQDSEGGGQGE